MTADASGNWSYQWCTTGNWCIPCGTLTATAQLGSQCESGPSNAFCINATQTCGSGTSITQTATPVITQNPLLVGATVSGTATATAALELRVNGTLAASTTLTGAATAYSFAGIGFKAGDVVTLTARVGTNCTSIPASRTATDPSSAPVVNGPVYANPTGTASIAGTSTEPVGTTITVFVNGTSIGTATVTATGSWTLTGVAAGTLAAGNTITATAQAVGKTASPTSNTVTVAAIPTRTAAPTITGSYAEGDTVVRGTATASSTVKVYIDGYLLGTVVATAGGAFTLAGLSRTLLDLYAGGVLVATAQASSQLESLSSNLVTVACATPSSRSFTPLEGQLCPGQSTAIRLQASAARTLYSLRNAGNTANAGFSKLGNGSDLDLGTVTLNTVGTTGFTVLAQWAESGNCPAALLPGSTFVQVNALPSASVGTSSLGQVCSGGQPSITVASTEEGFTYQLYQGATALGSPTTGTGQALPLTAPAITTATTYSVRVVDATKPTACAAMLAQTQAIAINCPAVYTISAALNQDAYLANQTLGTVTDPEGAVNLAYLAAGSLPAGINLDGSTGAFGVGTPSALVPGTYTLSVSTRDAGGFITTQPVTLRILPDAEASQTVAPAKSPVELQNGDELASVQDADGTLTAVSLASGTLPAGVSLGTDGRLTVTNRSALQPGTYTVSVSTVDATGGRTTQALTFTINALAPLPLYLARFEVRAAGQEATLYFATTAAQPAGKVAIIRQAEGSAAETIGWLAVAAGAGSYRFTDKPAAPGLYHYQLSMPEADGTTSLSPMRQVRLLAPGRQAQLRCWPNPARQTLFLDMGTQAGSVSLYNAQGARLMLPLPEAVAGDVYALPVADLAPGLYVVRVASAEGTAQVAFVKP